MLLSIGPLGTNDNEILIKLQNFAFTKMHLKIVSANSSYFVHGDMSKPFFTITSMVGVLCNIVHPSETHLKTKSRETSLVNNPYPSWPFVPRYFVQSTTVSLRCSVQNLKTIGKLLWMLWTNEIPWDLSLKWVQTDFLYGTASQVPETSI